MGKIRKHRKSGMKGKGKAEGDDRDEGGEETTGMGVCVQGGAGGGNSIGLCRLIQLGDWAYQHHEFKFMNY